MQTKPILVMCVLGYLVSVLCCPDAVAGVKARAHIQSVNRNMGKDAGGKRIYQITVHTTQSGLDFAAILQSSFEVTDGAGQKYYGTNTATQVTAYKSQSDCEWIIEVKTDGIDRPSLTGYAIDFYAPDVAEPLNWKTSTCKDTAELAARNKDSKPLTVHERSVTLVSKDGN
jgi:hypothetical protein